MLYMKGDDILFTFLFIHKIKGLYIMYFLFWIGNREMNHLLCRHCRRKQVVGTSIRGLGLLTKNKNIEASNIINKKIMKISYKTRSSGLSGTIYYQLEPSLLTRSQIIHQKNIEF